jgi:hypothetical protein
MMFVGDSLNRGQYVSMVCLLNSIIPEDAKSMETFDSLTVFTAKVIKLKFTYTSDQASVQILRYSCVTFSSVSPCLGIQCHNRVLLGAISS